MIKKISEIMVKDFISVDVCDGVLKVEKMFAQKKSTVALVFENTSLTGILTHRCLLNTHPNRIVADAMSTKIITIPIESTLWKAKEEFEKHDTEVLVVINHSEPVGLLPKSLVSTELGKHTDLLTGLYKSEYIYYKTQQIIETAHYINIIFIDINNFGYIDKQYGHIIGDIILKEIGNLLKNNIPNDTYICRFGGDEFVIVTPYPLEKNIHLAQSLIKSIETHSFINNISLTISAGMAGFKNKNNHFKYSFSDIINLINIASLESTKAKKEKTKLSIAKDFDIISIA